MQGADQAYFVRVMADRPQLVLEVLGFEGDFSAFAVAVDMSGQDHTVAARGREPPGVGTRVERIATPICAGSIEITYFGSGIWS